MFARRMITTAVIAFASSLCLHSPLQAQNAPPDAGNTVTTPGSGPVLLERGTLRAQLERMRYEPGERGPLLCVASAATMDDFQNFKRPLPGAGEPGATPLMIADAFERRLFLAGNVTVLAPREMTIINGNPGKANPLEGMEPRDVMRAFVGTLSENQWQKMGSDGIGLGDLDKDQAALMRQILPHVSAVRPTKVVVNPDKPSETRYENDGERVPVNPAQFRLKLSRTATFTYDREDGNSMRYLSGNYRAPKNGERVWNTEMSDASDGRDRKSAFGVKIVQTQPNRLKRSDLNFSAPVFNAAISLESTEDMPLKTLGDVLKRVQQATKIELRADARIAGLPCYVRTAPGQIVRAGDVLMALAYSVTGAYRQLGPRLFLLTDDVEGIGTRFARLNAWADAAQREREELLTKYRKQAAKQRPLRFLSFSADFNVLPDDISQKIEAAWQKGSGGVQMSVASLPQNVQKDVEAGREQWARMKEPVYLSKDKVSLSMTASAQWVLPNGGTYYAFEISDFGMDTLRELSVSEETPRPAPDPPTTGTVAPAKPPAPAPLFPGTLARRILLLAPTTAAEAKQLVELAHARGFNEIWVRQDLDDTACAPLKAAIAAAKPLKIPVGAIAPLLRYRKGDDERTISGLTGAQWSEDFTRQHQTDMRSFRSSTGWVTPPDGEDKALGQQLLSLCAIPGLAGVCVVNTTPPGYGDKTEYGDPVTPGSELGYTLSRRIAFLSSKGYDPIDIIQNNWTLNIEKDLPFFSNEWSSRYKQVGDDWVVDNSYVPPPDQWKQFRVEQVQGYLAALHAAVRARYPKLPLYIEDRTSAYGYANLSWYGSWDSADRLPKNPVYGDTANGVSAARAASSIILLRAGWQEPEDMPNGDSRFFDVVRSVAKQAERPGKPWAGIALDLSDVKTQNALRLLTTLPLEPAAKNQ